jgi:ATP-dependent helicase/nuclease subunit A
MERVDLVDGRNLKALAQIKAIEQSIPEKAEEIGALCERCLRHPLLERARRSRRIFREIPFSVSLNEKVVEGKIDLLFEEEEGWVVVDYKTDQVSGEALEQRFQFYREQGTWYAEAVQKATGSDVKEVVFFFVQTGVLRMIKKGE